MNSPTTIAAWSILLLSATKNIVYAQQEAAAVCSCSPSSITFRLDFTNTCDDNTVLIGKTHGIDRSFCRTDDVVGEQNAQPPAVVELSSILILELDSALRVIKQHFRDNLGLRDGQALKPYESILATSTTDDTKIAAIQMALTGITADGMEIQSQFILTYTNLCSIDVFRVGDAISWLVVDEIVPAPDNLCKSGPFPNLATSASSSNDIPPDLIDTPNDEDHVSNDKAGMDRSSEPTSLSIQMLRRLDFSEWLDESSDLLGKGDTQRGADGGLDRKLRRRRLLVE